jgi:hypothetical protein
MPKKREPTKDEKLIARIGLISALNEQGDLSDADATERIKWLMDEHQNGSPIDALKKVFGKAEKK